MAKNDLLDTILNHRRLTDEDVHGYTEILGLEPLPAYASRVLRRKTLNAAIRSAHGHSALNLFRDEYEPGYDGIVREVAAKLKVPFDAYHSVEEIEDKILVKVLEQVKEQSIKKDGPKAWDELEKEVETELREQVRTGKITGEAALTLQRLRGPALMAALFGGKLAGFALYMVANTLFHQVARMVGLRVGVALAGPIIGRSLALLLGPAGWALTGVLLIYDLGNTNWKKVIPAVVLTAIIRKRIATEEES